MYTFVSILEPAQDLGKWEINILIKNPEIVFVADMTRNDAPALVITTQCEICCKGDPESNTVTAAIKDLQVRACPFLPAKRKGKITTVSSLSNSITSYLGVTVTSSGSNCLLPSLVHDNSNFLSNGGQKLECCCIFPDSLHLEEHSKELVSSLHF